MFAFFAMVFAFVVGCGTTSEAENTYNAIHDAAKAGDKAKLEELVDCNDAKFKAAMIEALIKGVSKDADLKEHVKSVEEKGDTAILTFFGPVESNLTLKKIDGKWKLQIIVPEPDKFGLSKVSESAAISSLEMFGMIALSELQEMLEPEM